MVGRFNIEWNQHYREHIVWIINSNMTTKRFSIRQSWDAIKYATELCQRSFESNFPSPPIRQSFLQQPPQARLAGQNYGDDDSDGQNLIDTRPASGDICYTPSLYSVDSILPQQCNTYSEEKIAVPDDPYTPDYHRPSSVIIVPDALPIEGEAVGFRTAAKEDLEEFILAHPLPRRRGRKLSQKFRYHWFSAYRRLFTICLLINIAVLGAMIARTSYHAGAFTYRDASTASGANLMVATLMRQEHVINLLFRLTCSLPRQIALSIRKRAAKVYSYGGLHAGCGVSAILWYVFTTTLIYLRFKSSGTETEYRILRGLSATTFFLLIVIVAISHPAIRRAHHDVWEMSHRFGGWTVIIFVWTQALIFAVSQARNSQQRIRKVLVRTPVFWFLLIITACLIYPWLRLRKRKVKAEILSSHAVRLYFDNGTLPTCVGYKLSQKPLLDNHGFAAISNTVDEEVGYSVIVSNAGDFTKNMITNPPSRVWTRGAPVTGVMRVATLFQRIIVVATGSGIGPALSFMNVRPDWPMRVIWSARDPKNTYGIEVVNAVLRADRRAIIVDTKKLGYPDMPALSYAAYESFGAEAVIVVSNPAVTAKVVFEMESRGVPAFGPIFDS